MFDSKKNLTNKLLRKWPKDIKTNDNIQMANQHEKNTQHCFSLGKCKMKAVTIITCPYKQPFLIKTYGNANVSKDPEQLDHSYIYIISTLHTAAENLKCTATLENNLKSSLNNKFCYCL